MKLTPESCFHLTVEIGREIHTAAVDGFGGSEGVREMALLESAVAAPQASFGGRSPYRDIAEVAAAYLFFSARIIRSSMATTGGVGCMHRFSPLERHRTKDRRARVGRADAGGGGK